MMTPGFAKPRSDLPWLPYSESDKVYVINAHNFPSTAWTPEVNGKMPVAAWVPSRDTAGNGTTTLTDLVGSNGGTLTNMDAATDWPADTGAGGVRALDFDGSNDLVQIGSGLLTAFPIAVSLWFRGSSAASFQSFFSCGENSVNNHISLGFANKKVSWSPRRSLVDVSLNSPANYDDGAWHHAVGVSLAANSHRLYVDGNLVASNSINLSTFPPLNRSAIGCIRRNTNASFFSGRIDDVRAWNATSIDATDVSDLFAAQRGGQA